MKTLLKLILGTIIIAFNFSVSCSDKQQLANWQSNEIAQQESKRSGELSKETLEYWQLRVAQSTFPPLSPIIIPIVHTISA